MCCSFVSVDLEGENTDELEEGGFAEVSQCPHRAAQEEEWEENI